MINQILAHLCPRAAPSIMDGDISHGPSYGHMRTWAEEQRLVTGVRLVHAQVDLDLLALTKLFERAMTGRP